MAEVVGRWNAGDQACMALALDAARRAGALGEVPVGAVIASGSRVLAVAHNLRETSKDPTAHAEMLALRSASVTAGGWRLVGATMYTTLEPCPMCAGALWLARVARLVFATPDARAGAAGTLYNVVADPRLNHRMMVEQGLGGPEAQGLLQTFFRALRSREGRGPGRVGPRGGDASAEGCPSG